MNSIDRQERHNNSMDEKHFDVALQGQHQVSSIFTKFVTNQIFNLLGFQLNDYAIQ